MLLLADKVNIYKVMQKTLKMTETVAHGYSSRLTHSCLEILTSGVWIFDTF